VFLARKGKMSLKGAQHRFGWDWPWVQLDSLGVTSDPLIKITKSTTVHPHCELMISSRGPRLLAGLGLVHKYICPTTTSP